MITHRSITAVLAVACASLLLLAGCYVSPFAIGQASDATVDRRFTGDWFAGDDLTILIRNFNDREYYVEWREGERMTRINGFLAKLGDATIANLRGITDDGTVEREYLLLRVELKDDELTLRHFREEFFEDKAIDSAEKLRQVVQENLDNSEMYAEQLVLKRRTEQ